jgi:hypothetical protein
LRRNWAFRQRPSIGALVAQSAEVRPFVILLVVLTGCGPGVGLDELTDYTVVFAAEQSVNGEVSGMVGFLAETFPGVERPRSFCRSLGERISVSMQGASLERTTGVCGPGSTSSDGVCRQWPRSTTSTSSSPTEST